MVEGIVMVEFYGITLKVVSRDCKVMDIVLGHALLKRGSLVGYTRILPSPRFLCASLASEWDRERDLPNQYI